MVMTTVGFESRYTSYNVCVALQRACMLGLLLCLYITHCPLLNIVGNQQMILTRCLFLALIQLTVRLKAIRAPTANLHGHWHTDTGLSSNCITSCKHTWQSMKQHTCTWKTKLHIRLQLKQCGFCDTWKLPSKELVYVQCILHTLYVHVCTCTYTHNPGPS